MPLRLLGAFPRALEGSYETAAPIYIKNIARNIVAHVPTSKDLGWVDIPPNAEHFSDLPFSQTNEKHASNLRPLHKWLLSKDAPAVGTGNAGKWQRTPAFKQI